MTKSLADYQQQIYDINVKNGWFDDDRSFGDDIALLHSEVSEMLEAYRDGGIEDQTGPEITMSDGSGEDIKTVLPKPEGVGSEAADVLVRLLDTCQRYDIDLTKELERKIAYNATRGYRHGGKRV